ncbi:hypothetical protein [Modicisalibacter luteus]|uniref:Uncharacterized protein n=1 Tax=Modicisalibacter luteus TaxID=453962 RepID=A0ABV7LYJ3_9GAMM|nr:hypothetical protein [Halomonas lutea]GHB12726.1 hypothetical protein GCM10007159_38750 [Halomonas lutea]
MWTRYAAVNAVRENRIMSQYELKAATKAILSLTSRSKTAQGGDARLVERANDETTPS